MKKQWEKLEKTVQQGADRNNYIASFSSSGCNFEIFINDIMLYSHLYSGGAMGSCPINYNILKSGEQTIKVKLYPVVGHEEKGINSERPLSLSISYSCDPDSGIYSYKPLLENILPVVKPGIPYFEYETTFHAEVPYELEGWSNCVDLRKIPNLKERVISKFTAMANMMIKKDFEALDKIVSFKFTEAHFASYMSPEESLEDVAGWYKELSDFETVDPMNNYELEFFRDGTLVTLLNPENKELGFMIRYPGFEWDQFFLLGMRKGSNQLEVIR